MDELPQGAVTMLFSDIEGSTRLLLALGDGYGELLDLHRAVLRRVWVASGGVEVDTEGDSFFVVFDRARDAVRAALRAHRELSEQPWPHGAEVTVRIGVHTGRPMRHGDGYVGADVHRAARIGAAAHGGQTLISEATWAATDGSLPSSAVMRDLGWHRLRDFTTPVNLFQAGAVGLRDAFPPVRTMGAASSLPLDPAPLIGRTDDLDALSDLVMASDARLVTLTGVAGVGKTRLAIALAKALSATFAHGVYFVPLAGSVVPDDVIASIRRALSIAREAPDAPALVDYLADRHVMLVLDTLEHLPEASAVVGDLLDRAPRLVVVATSRRPLRLRQEHEYVVDPLPVKETDETDDVLSSPAILLFGQRAAMARRDFVVTDANVAAVAAICQRLDGLPLAIELAAAQMKILSPSTLLARLHSAVDLGTGIVGAAPRHRTLRQAMAWSYDLLSPDQQRTFRRLAVFVGGFSFQALEQVGQVAPSRSLEAVSELVDSSLVVLVPTTGDTRFGLLNTVADFALEKLALAGEIDQTRRRHADHLLDLVGQFSDSRGTGRETEVRMRLRAETENLRATLEWALGSETPDPDDPARAWLGVRLATRLAPFWFRDLEIGEGRQWLSRALDLDDGAPTWERASALRWLAEFNDWAGVDPGPAIEAALAMLHDLDDPALEWEVRLTAARLQLSTGDHQIVVDNLDRCMELAVGLDDRNRLGWTLWFRAWWETTQGAHDVALALLEQASTEAVARGDELVFLMAETATVECLASLGRLDEAQGRLLRIMLDAPRLENTLWAVHILDTAAQVCAGRGLDELAARLHGAHLSHLSSGGGLVDGGQQDERLELSALTASRQRLGETQWARSIAIGQEYALQKAFAEAVPALTEHRGPPGHPG